MEEQEINELFEKEIKKRSVGREAGLTKDQIYAYRHRETSTGTKLEVLWKLDKLEFKL